MSYADYEEKLDRVVQNLPQEARDVFSERPVISTIEGVGGGDFGLTMGEIGELCELVRQVITKERKVEDFEAGLREKLDEDNQEKAGEITAEVNEKVFVKLLPVLGLKPLPLTVRSTPNPAVPVSEVPPTAQTSPTSSLNIPSRLNISFDEDGSSNAPEKPVAQPVLKTPPPVPPNLPTGQPVTSYMLHATSPVHVMPPPPASVSGSSSTPMPAGSESRPIVGAFPKTPLVETSHERMSENPLDSLIKMMEGKVSDKELARHFDKLPESLKEALKSVDSAKKVVDIGRKYMLHVDKIGELGAETGMVILGFTHPADFLSRLSRRLSLGEEKTKPIAQEINTEIFLKIREALKEVHEGGEVGKPRRPDATSGVGVPTEASGSKVGETPKQTAVPLQAEPVQKPSVTKEESLDRDIILRDIEGTSPALEVESRIKNQESRTGEQQSKPSVPIPPAVPPKPPEVIVQKAPPAPIEDLHWKTDTEVKASAPSNLPTITESHLLAISASETSEIKSVSAPVPSPIVPTPIGIVEQKLSQPTVAKKIVKEYTLDPYREAVK